VKLLDFGLARVAGAARLTAQSTVLGTPAYLAPEILTGKGCDARADLYALGAVLFELFSGERAFDSADPFEVIRRKGQPPPSPRARRKEVSEADDLLVRRALEPDPERRFLDAGQVLSALAGKPPPAPMAPPPALTAGALDVVLHHGALADKAPVEDVLRAVGSPAGTGWRARLRLAGEAVLVSKASRDTAEAIAALCQERGLAVALQPAEERSPLRERVAGLAVPIGGATGLAAGGAYGAMLFSMMGIGALGPSALFAGTVGAGFGLLIGAVSWTLAGLGEAPPLRALPAGDPAVRRLLEGIQRRTARLEARRAELPGAQQVLYGPLLETAERLRAAALELGESAAAMPDPLAMGETGAALSAGNAAARDATVARLLEIAAALDDALATLEPGNDPGPEQEQALARLKAEVEFAQAALPRIERARRGEETPLPA
jgi:hypothetical protein